MHEGACLGRAQMFEADGRDLAAAEEPASQQPAMPGDDPELGINEDRHVEAEGGDAVGDLADLLSLRV
jgi:hypothetical protein